MKLTDTQLVLLSAASQREDGAVVLAPNLKGGAASKVVGKLLRDGLIEFRRWRELKRLLPQLSLSRSGLPLRQGARGTSNGSRLLSPKRQLQENRE
jgi:hypothetical protein